MITGGCLCGGVRYEVDGVDFMNHCHCSICRRHTGAAYGTFAHARADAFRWRSGENLLTPYQSSAQFRRSFCRVCGTKAPVVYADANRVVIPAGGLDGDPGVRPLHHIYVGSKAPWHEITDDLPRLDEGPPGDA